MTIRAENEAVLHCRKNDAGIEILRAITEDSVLALPDEIEGRPVVALGDYALSSRAPKLPEGCFSVQLSCGGIAPTVHSADRLQRLILPQGLISLGSYALYNCTALREIRFGAALCSVGAGALMNCRSLQSLQICAAPSAATALPKLLGEHSGRVRITFLEGAQAALLFPPFSEESETLSPAHIFQNRIHGAGYGYRQCFEAGVLRFLQYDNALPSLLDRHEFALAAEVAFLRLCTPTGLYAAAKEQYTACLAAHGAELACAFAKEGDTEALHRLLGLSVLPPEAIEAACNAARESGQTAALSLLLPAGKQAAPRGRGKSYTL